MLNSTSNQKQNFQAMITQEQIEETVNWKGLKEFGLFVLSHCDKSSLPDYKVMDLMKIPRLVPNIWVFDLREYDQTGVAVVNFAGENVIKLHGQKIIGNTLEGAVRHFEHSRQVDQMYKQSIEEKTTAYSKRYEKHTDDHGRERWTFVEAMHFPCSSDGMNVNWGIGCVQYTATSNEGEVHFLQF